MTKAEVRRVGELRLAAAGLAVLFIVYFAVLVSVTNFRRPYNTIFELSASAVFLAIEVMLLNYTQRKHYCNMAALLLFLTVRELERNERFWNRASFRAHIAIHLETTAKKIERIPLGLSRIAPVVRRDAFALSAGKARAMRELQSVLVMSNQFGYSDILKRLTDDMQVLAVGCWYDLPGQKYQPRAPRWLIALQICGASIVIAAMVAVIGLAPKIGPVAPALAPILGTIAVFIFNKAGFPLGTVERASQVAANLSTEQK